MLDMFWDLFFGWGRQGSMVTKPLTQPTKVDPPKSVFESFVDSAVPKISEDESRSEIAKIVEEIHTKEVSLRNAFIVEEMGVKKEKESIKLLWEEIERLKLQVIFPRVDPERFPFHVKGDPRLFMFELCRVGMTQGQILREIYFKSDFFHFNRVTFEGLIPPSIRQEIRSSKSFKEEEFFIVTGLLGGPAYLVGFKYQSFWLIAPFGPVGVILYGW